MDMVQLIVTKHNSHISHISSVLNVILIKESTMRLTSTPKLPPEDPRTLLKNILRARDENTEHIIENGRRITRIRMSLKDLSATAALRRKAAVLEAKEPRAAKPARKSSPVVIPPCAEFLSEPMLAQRWYCSRSRLQHWRSTGQGPAFVKLGGRVLYSMADIKEFEAAHRISRAAASAPK